MGDRSLRGNDGCRTSRWRLAHHSHARASYGDTAASARLRGRNNSRVDHSRRELLRHSAFHYSCDFHVDYGRGRGETFQRNALDSGRTNYLDLAFHSSSERPNRLRARTHGRSALILCCRAGLRPPNPIYIPAGQLPPPASRHTKVTLIFLPPRSVFSTFATIRNAGLHVSPEESSASFYHSAAILLRQIARGANALSRWMDLRRAP